MCVYVYVFTARVCSNHVRMATSCTDTSMSPDFWVSFGGGVLKAFRKDNDNVQLNSKPSETVFVLT